MGFRAMTRRRCMFLPGALASCGRRSGLRLLTFPESYGHHLSIGQGYYSEQGLNVNADYFQAFPRMMEALLAGEGDVATAYYDALLPLAAAGREVVAFACLANRPGSVLAVSPAAKHSIGSIEDLRGAVVGIPGPGSSSHHLLNAILRKRGLDPQATSTAAIGVAAGAIAAMEKGTVDAAMMTNLGLATLRLKDPGVRTLADLRTAEGAREYLGHPQYPAMCLVATRQWLAANAESARKVARCFLQANRWMVAHTPEQIRQALPTAAQAPDARADVEAIRGIQPTMDTAGRLNLADAEAVYRVVAASVATVRDAKIDLQRTFTSDFV